MLLLRAETYYSSPRRGLYEVLTKVLAFLGVQPPASEAEWKPLLEPPIALGGQRPVGGMPAQAPETTSLLKRFYRPGLIEVAELLRAEPDAAEWREWAAMAEQSQGQGPGGGAGQGREGGSRSAVGVA